jgi:L-2,4-diaminobutyrate decarboxylase
VNVEQFRTLGHRVVDRLAAYLDDAAARRLPVLPWRRPEDALAEWPADFPDAPDGDALALLERVIAGSIHLHHPRYVGHQVSAPRPDAALWELVGAVLNNGMAVYEMGPAATAMERNVLAWLAAQLGLPRGADGVLTSGGSVGNLTALLAARHAAAPEVWKEGGHAGPPLALLVAETAHYSVKRAVQTMGWGAGGAVPVEVDARFRLRPDALAGAAARAEAAGRRVIAVVASAGSTATGAYDPLPAVADFCAARGLWLHVDGAHGAAAAFSARHRELVDGIGRADSLILDAHKLMAQPALVTAVLFRDGRRSYGAFAEEASYLFEPDDDRGFDLGLRTLECTKRMMALQLYATLALGGTAALGAHVDGLFALAARFAARLAAEDGFEVIPPSANIVCFRHRPAGESAAATDERMVRVRQALLESGGFYLVKTRLDGVTWLRTALMNPATTDADLEALITAVRTA